MMPTDGNPIAEHATARARILIVEDNPLNRLLVHDLLELRGHAVVEAATVDEARARSTPSGPISCCSTCRSRAAAARR